MTRFKLGRGASSDALALMVIKLVTISLGFVVTRLLSQNLSAHDYGTYSQILLMVSTVSSLTILGMMDGINYFYCSRQNAEEREAYVATLFSMQCVVGTVTGMVVLALQTVLVNGFANPDMKQLLIFAAALPLLQNLVSMLQILMVSIGKARMIAFRNLAVSLVRLGAVLVVITLFQNVAVMLAASVLLDAAQIALFGWYLRLSGCLVRLSRTDFRLTKQILTYCLPMAVFTMLNTLNRDCDKYLISVMTDTETLAVYANASKVLPFDILMTSFCTVLLPEITRLVSEKEHRRAAALYKQFLEIAYISTAALCCGALAAAPQLMELLYSEKYLSGLSVFVIYILVDMIRFTNITMILSAAGKTAKLMVLGAGTLGANVVLNVAFYRYWGITGPALATLAITALTGIIMLHQGARELGIKLQGFFEGRYLLRFGAECAAMVFLFAKLRQILAEAGMHYFVILILIGGGCVGILLLCNVRRLLRNLRYVDAE